MALPSSTDLRVNYPSITHIQSHEDAVGIFMEKPLVSPDTILPGEGSFVRTVTLSVTRRKKHSFLHEARRDRRPGMYPGIYPILSLI